MGNPEDEYEISEACDDEEDCMEKDRSHKHVPEWSLMYTENIKKQAYTDPDTIFGPSVPKVSMDDIFTEANYAASAVFPTAPQKERPQVPLYFGDMNEPWMMLRQIDRPAGNPEDEPSAWLVCGLASGRTEEG